MNVLHKYFFQVVIQKLASCVKRIDPEVKVGIITGVHLVVHSLVHNAIPVSLFNESRVSIIFPMSDSISHHESFEVRNVISLLSCVICDVLIQPHNKLRNVNTSIRLTGNVKIIFVDLRV